MTRESEGSLREEAPREEAPREEVGLLEATPIANAGRLGSSSGSSFEFGNLSSNGAVTGIS